MNQWTLLVPCPSKQTNLSLSSSKQNDGEQSTEQKITLGNEKAVSTVKCSESSVECPLGGPKSTDKDVSTDTADASKLENSGGSKPTDGSMDTAGAMPKETDKSGDLSSLKQSDGEKSTQQRIASSEGGENAATAVKDSDSSVKCHLVLHNRQIVDNMSPAEARRKYAPLIQDHSLRVEPFVEANKNGDKSLNISNPKAHLKRMSYV